uniref:Uncharacterized protein n=1 Tax=Anopheles maculatus TaxID=74869 RepID=A0A182SHF6_9DIPT
MEIESPGTAVGWSHLTRTSSEPFEQIRAKALRTYVISFSEVFDFKNLVHSSRPTKPETDNNRQQDMLLVVPLFFFSLAWRTAWTAAASPLAIRHRTGSGFGSGKHWNDLLFPVPSELVGARCRPGRKRIK